MADYLADQSDRLSVPAHRVFTHTCSISQKHGSLEYRQRYTEEHNLNRYIALKTFFYLRENFRAREAGLLEKLDGQFLQQCEEMKRALLEEGVDYGPF